MVTIVDAVLKLTAPSAYTEQNISVQMVKVAL